MTFATAALISQPLLPQQLFAEICSPLMPCHRTINQYALIESESEEVAVMELCDAIGVNAKLLYYFFGNYQQTQPQQACPYIPRGPSFYPNMGRYLGMCNGLEEGGPSGHHHGNN